MENFLCPFVKYRNRAQKVLLLALLEIESQKFSQKTRKL